MKFEVSGKSSYSLPISAISCLILSLVVLRSIFEPGYVLIVDSVFGPVAPHIYAGFGVIYALVINLLGGEISSKFFYFLCVLLAGLLPAIYFSNSPLYVQIPAAIFGALNPYIYDRLVEGQFSIAFGYVGLFLILIALSKFEQAPTRLNALFLALAISLDCSLDEHMIGISLVLLVAWFLAIGTRKAKGKLLFLASLFLGYGLLAYGIVTFFLGHSGPNYHTVARFGKADLLAFKAVASHRYGLWINLLSLYGYWGEALQRFPLLKSGFAWWPLTSLGLLVAAVVSAAIDRDKLWLLGVGLFSVLVAGSTATNVGLNVFINIGRYFPLIYAYREPEKWLSLWATVEVVLVFSLPTVIMRYFRNRKPLIGAACSMVLLICVLVPSGGNAARYLPSTIVPVQYPKTWLLAASFVKHHIPKNQSILVLPWYQYVTLPFTHYRLTANPASSIFPGKLILPNDLLIPGKISEQPSPGHLAQIALSKPTLSCRLASKLESLDIHWVIIEPAGGYYQTYFRLTRCDFKKVFGNTNSVMILHYQN